MNRTTRTGIVVGAALVVAALAGCTAATSSLTHAAGSSSTTQRPVAAAPATPTTQAAPATKPAAPTTAVAVPSTSAAPAAPATPSKAATAPVTPQRAVRPPQPATPTRNATTVPGLAAAITTTAHPGLSICQGHLFSLVAAAGVLRGIGSTQYLVDTTCQGATGSTPDEVAIYQSVGGALERTAVLYQPAVGVPRLTAYPYLDGAHTVVMTYADVSEWQLIHIGASSISFGPLERS